MASSHNTVRTSISSFMRLVTRRGCSRRTSFTTSLSWVDRSMLCITNGEMGEVAGG
jgi:hypothetical protein